MIGGNIVAKIQTKIAVKNEIGEAESVWSDAAELVGWLDLSSGEAKYGTYYAKIEESTHVFVSDYCELGNINAQNSRMIVNESVYDIVLIDNPMELNRQLEIYLKYTGR